MAMHTDYMNVFWDTVLQLKLEALGNVFIAGNMIPLTLREADS